VIDLHLHTTASDGRLTPSELVIRAAGAGLRILGVTDHDTTAGLAEAEGSTRAQGLRLVPGIEITAVEHGRDVHVLGYFIDRDNRQLSAFLEAQRADRRRRVARMADLLGSLGHRLDLAGLLDVTAIPGRSIGRPQLADALVAAGHAIDRRDAFDRLLGEGRPAFVPRSGATVAEVIGTIHAAGGLASLAHPGLLRMDEEIPAFAVAGLDALEVRHIDHDCELEERYRRLAVQLGLAMTGGSDYHGGDSDAPGAVTLSGSDFAELERRARHMDAAGSRQR
jgi:predicted metal-dependent phosphoesterase TrpH